jgi:hypothetical protein
MAMTVNYIVQEGGPAGLAYPEGGAAFADMMLFFVLNR